jgi:very-short-patch-repair endonuclease
VVIKTMPNQLKERAKELRSNPTDAEQHLWQHLRNKQMMGCKFRRQEVIGTYIVDFVCVVPKLVVELDGGQHSEQRDYDEKLSAYLASLGYEVMRFWNDEVLNQTEAVLEKIYTHLTNNR